MTSVKEKTVTCEEIQGTGPAHEGDKAGKEREWKKIKRVKLPEGRRKEGYCACALTGCMMKLVFVLCAVTGGKGVRKGREGGNQWQITLALLAHCTVWPLYPKEGTYKMMQPNGGWTPRSFLLIWKGCQYTKRRRVCECWGWDVCHRASTMAPEPFVPVHTLTTHTVPLIFIYISAWTGEQQTEEREWESGFPLKNWSSSRWSHCLGSGAQKH